jgi:hypothetical protein
LIKTISGFSALQTTDQLLVKNNPSRLGDGGSEPFYRLHRSVTSSKGQELLMSRSLLSTAASICFGSLLLLGCQPTESGSTGTTVAPSTTTTVAHNNGDGDGNNGGGNGGGNGGAAATGALSCDALRAANARLADLSMLLGNITQPVLDQARLGDAGGLDPRTMGKTIGVLQPLAAADSDMADSLGNLQPVFELLGASLQGDNILSPSALADLQAGGGVVAAVAEKLQDTLKHKCPADGDATNEGSAPTTTTIEAPGTTEAPATTEAPSTSTTEAPAPSTTEAPTTTEAPATTTTQG